MTPEQFEDYVLNWMGVLEASGRSREEATAWLKDGATHRKPRVRVKAPTRMIGSGVPDDAQPGDLVVGNRGAAAMVIQPLSQFGGLSACLTLEYVGNYYSGVVRPADGRKMYDFR